MRLYRAGRNPSTGKQEEITVTVAAAVEAKLTGSDYGSGQIETLNDQSRAQAKAIAFIMQKMHDRQMISRDDMHEFIPYDIQIED